MPRVSDIYAPPSGTLATTLTPASSAAYNAFVTDVAADLNAPRPIAAGGTGATTAAGARTALGVPDAATIQPVNANLTSLSGLTFAANKGLYTTGANTAALFDLTAAGLALLDDADPAAQRTTLELGTAAVLNTSTDPDFAGVAPTSLATRATIKTLVDATAAAAVTAGVPAAVPGAIAALAAGDISTTVFAYHTGGDVAFGGNVAGSTLRPTSAVRSFLGSSTNANTLSAGSALAGTWQCRGQFDATNNSATDGSGGQSQASGATEWLRIA